MGELRDEIARTIADSIRVNFHSANGLHVAELMGDALAAADRILALPEIANALKLGGIVTVEEMRARLHPPISTNTSP